MKLLVVAVSAVLSGADTFVEIEAWNEEKLDWLWKHLRLCPFGRAANPRRRL
ncbi:MAG TPA: ISAs1 family transposase, partial [Candidatus Accumulibacter sp.]|nr:ISAs1 family transposase [Accumulibacter sp.]